jgi:thioredoxin reductase (NADPH)
MVKGWVNPEEWLYPQVQEALSAWFRTHRPSHVIYRVVGEQWDSRCHDLRDGLTVNGVPFVFHPRDSDIGRQLIRDHEVDVSRLPAVIRHDGAVLQDPSLPELAGSHGIQSGPATASTTWWSSAPVPRGWPPPSTVRRRACAPCCSRPGPSAGRPAPVP